MDMIKTRLIHLAVTDAVLNGLSKGSWRKRLPAKGNVSLLALQWRLGQESESQAESHVTKFWPYPDSFLLALSQTESDLIFNHGTE
jgi:hypothetical protein